MYSGPSTQMKMSITMNSLPDSHAANRLRHLILWRHAEAEAGRIGLGDRARSLTPKGEKQAARMGLWLRNHLPEKTHVIVSPAMRTRQTASALEWPYQVVDAIAPEGSHESLWQAALESGAEAVLLVGHQPSLGQLAAFLLAGEAQSLSVKKGAIWWLTFGDGLGSRAQVKLRTVLASDQV